MKNKTMQHIKKTRSIKSNPELLNPFAIVSPKPKLKTLDPKDYKHLLQAQSKEEKKRYWSKTSLIILFFTILIIYLYHFS